MRGHSLGRDSATGRYTETDFDRMCCCGHTLRNHTAARIRGLQPCNACDACDSFTSREKCNARAKESR